MKVANKVVTGMLKTNVHDHWLYKVRMQELENLLLALGYSPVYRVIQTRKTPTTAYLFGPGKVEEIKRKIEMYDAELFAVYNILTSKQKWNLERALGVEVLDRYEVTLKIFEQEAKDVLSNLQIKLAILQKSFPYIKYKASLRYKRMRAGFRGGGEYAYHKVLRAVQKRIKKTRTKIERLMELKEERILKRKEEGSIVVLSGYYNAGKTSLFNALTGLDKPVSDAPFTTLSSKYSSIMEGRVFLVDTIGFVIDLDPRLFHSFKLNLLDLKYADAIVLVLDISEKIELIKLKLREGLSLIRSLRGETNSVFLALNKIDRLDEDELSSRIESIREDLGDMPYTKVSALTGEGLDDLLKKLDKFLMVTKGETLVFEEL
ncbi:MAG: hypothetical protein DRO05_03505 [Thermoproteota archaeon]|nr:MAG: hypothetical protein DRO05_03505 [Candidatus Korarchaeota archaeon]